jgi:error-prone DNA polymerase
VLGVSGGQVEAIRALRQRCEAGMGDRYPGADASIEQRLSEELGFASYFLTVADVVDLIRGMGRPVAARGSGAGSLVNYLLGISGVDPMRYNLLMERFLSPLRRRCPTSTSTSSRPGAPRSTSDPGQRFGGDRVACVSMMDTYRVRHAIRDVGAALGLPPGEIDAIAKRSRTSAPATPATRCATCPSCAPPASASGG